MREIKFLLYLKTDQDCRKYAVTQIEYKRYGDFDINRIYYGDYYVIGEALKNGFANLAQYTGLKDVNGREIYEGDIVKGKYYTQGKENRFIGQVKFLSPSFQVVGINQYYGMNQELNSLYEVIGNIYENKEFLGETK